MYQGTNTWNNLTLFQCLPFMTSSCFSHVIKISGIYCLLKQPEKHSQEDSQVKNHSYVQWSQNILEVAHNQYIDAIKLHLNLT